MKVKVYAYKNCDTCRKALKFLATKNMTYDEIDITTTAPTYKELQSMLEHYGR